MKVFIILAVFEGSIEKVFLNEEDAEAYKNAMGFGWGVDIEEHEACATLEEALMEYDGKASPSKKSPNASTFSAFDEKNFPKTKKTA